MQISVEQQEKQHLGKSDVEDFACISLRATFRSGFIHSNSNRACISGFMSCRVCLTEGSLFPCVALRLEPAQRGVRSECLLSVLPDGEKVLRVLV